MKRILNILDMILRIFRKRKSEKNGNETVAKKEKIEEIRLPARKYRRRVYRNNYMFPEENSGEWNTEISLISQSRTEKILNKGDQL